MAAVAEEEPVQAISGSMRSFRLFSVAAHNKCSARIPRGSDLRYDIEITLEEAAFGFERVIHPRIWKPAPPVMAPVRKAGMPVPCPACHGTGRRRQTSANFFGMQFISATPCEKCGATGEIIHHPCHTCGGQGRVRATEQLQVPIPPASTPVHASACAAKAMPDCGERKPATCCW